MLSKQIGIGFSCFNRLENVKLIINKLREIHFLDQYYTVFASDGCNDGTQDFLKEQKDVISILMPNRGVAANKNRILKSLKNFEYIFILEDDIQIINQGFISCAIDISKISYVKHLNYGCTAKYRPAKLDSLDVVVSGTLNGQFIFVTKEVFKKVGYFNEAFGRYGYEHNEWTHRICRSGFYSWGSFYMLNNPQSYFTFLSDKGGMDIHEKIHWVHKINPQIYKKLVLGGAAEIFRPEPKEVLTIVNNKTEGVK